MLAASEDARFLHLHLRQLLEVAIRVRLTVSSPDEQALKVLKEKASEMLDALEAKVGSSVFVGAYGEMQRKIQSSKASKKKLEAAEAVSNPQAFAMKKVRLYCILSPSPSLNELHICGGGFSAHF